MAGGTHLELEERERLAALKAEGLSLRAIARALGRAASTVSRELRRNALPRGGYLPVHAEGCYRERRQRPAVLERDERLGRFVRERLLEGWTPEQIAGWLKRGEERGLRPVSLETIYAFVHRPGQKGEKLWKLLPRGRARRGRRRARQPRSTIAGRRSIHDRPEDVQERKDAGHWEGDLLICKRTRPVLVLKERKTRFVLAARLAGKSAAETVAVLMAVFRRLDPRLRSSITFDNDTAFARHGLLASACSMTTWFCDAYASWQKGAVENANGRLRRDLPRDLDLDALGRRRAAGDRAQPQSHAAEVPRLPHPAPSVARGAWQGRADPLRLTRCASPVNPPPSGPRRRAGPARAARGWRCPAGGRGLPVRPGSAREFVPSWDGTAGFRAAAVALIVRPPAGSPAGRQARGCTSKEPGSGKAAGSVIAVFLHAAAGAAVVSRLLSGMAHSRPWKPAGGRRPDGREKGDPSGGTVPYGATLAGGEGHGRPPPGRRCARLDTT